MKRYLAGLLAAVMLLSTMGTGALAEPVAETNVETIEAQTSEAPAQATEEKIEEQPAEKKEQPAEQPTVEATKTPAEEPAEKPSAEPTVAQAEEPTEAPAVEPTEEPSEEPTEAPSEETTEQPSEEPTAAPSEEPTEAPSEQPTEAPSEEPTAAPSEEPTVEPSEEPTVEPSEVPTVEPRTAAELAEALGFETVEALAEAMEMDVSELEALSAEEIAALYAQLTDPSLQAAALAASDFTVVDGVLTAYTGSDVDVVIPGDLGITKIGNSVFSFTGIQSVVIPEGVTVINSKAFFRCEKLWSVDFPSTLKEIGEMAFKYCYRLASVDIPGSVESIGEETFMYCIGLTNVNLHENLKAIQQLAFSKCVSLTEVRLPESLTVLGCGTFSDCDKLESVYIPGTITTIQASAFARCHQLETVRIGEGITVIGQLAFYACPKLREITLPKGLMHIECRAFEDCTALTKVVLPSSLDAIEWYAFKNDCALHSIVIPENVKTMEDDIFKDCDSLTVGVYPGSVALTYCQTNDIPYVVLVPQAVRSVIAEQKSIDAKDCAVATFTVKTSKKALSLKLCAESGAQVAEFTEKNAQVVASDDGLTWTFDYAFVNDGKRELSLIAATEDGDCKAWPITADMRGTRVKAASFPGAWAERGRAAQIRVTTNMGADTLRMYSENGALICTWPAEGNSAVSGSDRVWSVTYAFANAGTRTMTFRALRSGAGGHTSASAQVKVELPVTVESVSASMATVTAKETLTFTVKTSANAKYVRMYSEGGYLVKNWAAEGNSTVNGSARIWTLSYAFGNAGDRTLTFRASADGTHFGEGKSASVTVLAVSNVTSAAASKATTTALIPVTLTATTPANGSFLTLYAEGGTKVKTWSCDGNSTVNGNVRTWTVDYAFGGAGNRRITLKASADGANYGSGRELAVTVLAVPNVTSAAASKATVTAQETLTLTATTPVNGYCLTLYAEGGTKVKTWNCGGNSTVNGNVRTWKVQYAFGGTGDRRVTLKASADGVHCGGGKELAVTVLAVPNVTAAEFTGTTVNRGEVLNIHVTAPANGTCLHMYLENGQLYRTWSSEGNSVVSGGNRFWNVSYSFSAAGARKLTFRVSADGVHAGAGMTASITVK